MNKIFVKKCSSNLPTLHYIWQNNISNTSLALLFGTLKALLRWTKTLNVSVRIMMDLSHATHKYFIHPLSGTDHIRKCHQGRCKIDGRKELEDSEVKVI